MRKYHTLVSDFEVGGPREELGPYLARQGITFMLGADFSDELRIFGYASPDRDRELKKIYTVLIEEHELSAIMLSVGGVQIIRNRRIINFKNKIRSMFSWIFR